MSGIKLNHDGWLVIADGEKALFLRNVGDEVYPNLEVFRELEHANPPDREQAADRPGRLSDGGNGSHRSAVQETDWHRIEKQRFAREIADRLYKRAQAGRFAQLVVVAPPTVLGDMRKEWHKQVRDRIVAEVAKDLTHHPVHEIEKLVLG